MKILCVKVRYPASMRLAGFTLVEMLMSLGVFSLAIIGILACHLAGLRLNLFVLPKIQNAQYSRQTLSHLIEEVRCANSVQIGTGTLRTFTAASPTNSQTGNAMRIYPTTNTAQYIYYYHDPASATLNKISLSGAQAYIMADSVTNDNIFAMQDFTGATLTNNQSSAVLQVLLQMRRSLPITGLSDPYQIQAKITRRSIF